MIRGHHPARMVTAVMQPWHKEAELSTAIAGITRAFFEFLVKESFYENKDFQTQKA